MDLPVGVTNRMSMQAVVYTNEGVLEVVELRAGHRTHDTFHETGQKKRNKNSTVFGRPGQPVQFSRHGD